MRCIEHEPSDMPEFDNFFEFADHVMSHDKHELKSWAENVLDSEHYINYRLK